MGGFHGDTLNGGYYCKWRMVIRLTCFFYPRPIHPTNTPHSIPRPKEIHHAVAVLKRRHEPQRDAHRARHHAVHHRQRRLVHTSRGKTLVVPDLLRDLLLRQTQRSVRRAGVTVPPCSQLRLTPPRHTHVNASLGRRLLHLREGHILSRGSLCHSRHLPAPTHIHRHDGPLRRVVA